MDAVPTLDGATGTLSATTVLFPPLIRSSLYVWVKFRSGSSSEVTGPVLYRNVFGFLYALVNVHR
jgi:hypothetical protein